MKKKMKSMQTLSLTYGLFGLLGLFIVGFVLYNGLASFMIQQGIKTTKDSVAQSGKYLEVYIDRLKTMSNLVSHNRDVVDYFSHMDEITAEDYEKRIDQLIQDILESDKTIKSIVIISKDGKVFSNEKELTMSMSQDMMKEEWYVNAIHSDMPKLTSARMQSFSMDKDLWVISVSEEIIDQNGNNIGVAVIDIPYTTIEAYLMDLNLGDGGYAFILNSQDRVVFHQDASYYNNDALVEQLIQIKADTSGEMMEDNLLISQYAMKNTDWTLVGVCKVDGILVVQRQIIETIALGFFVIFVGVVFTSILLRKLTEELSKKEESIHNYAMNSLYSQINPHFLYNTLDTIVWMAEFNQSEDVIKTTKSLARFFRLSLNQGKKVISLQDEIEHIKQYLYIQKQRYQEKLEYTVEIEENLLSYQVPKIILQPIVENCIYHGIQEKEGTGWINIKVEQSKDRTDVILITIRDNGVGFESKHQLADLPESNKTRLGGVGLKNVNERVQLYFGTDCGLTIQSEPNVGTTVILRIKKMKDDKKTEEIQ